MKRLPYFNDVIREFIAYVGDRNLSIIEMFRSELRRELRNAYKQGYNARQSEINQEQGVIEYEDRRLK